jgi:long-chain acyl-CoA synthetase
VPLKQAGPRTAEAPSPAQGVAPVGGVGRAIAWLSRELARALGAIELSPPQYRVLILLSDGSAVSSDVAERLAVSRPTVTSVVDGLVNRGLVERRHSEDDRRRVSLTLTKEGREILARADRDADALLADVAGNLGDAELADRALTDLGLWSDALVARHQAKLAGKATESRTTGSQP